MKMKMIEILKNRCFFKMTKLNICYLKLTLITTLNIKNKIFLQFIKVYKIYNDSIFLKIHNDNYFNINNKFNI